MSKTGNINTDGNEAFVNDARRKVARNVVVSARRFNTFKSVKTTITTSATFIEFPEECTDCILYHLDTDETLYLGDSNQIVAAADDVAPIPSLFTMQFEVIRGNNNNIYGIVSTGTIDVYVIGLTRE